MKAIFLLLLVLLITSSSGYGQSNCQKEKIYGEWRRIASLPGKVENLDRLKKAIHLTKMSLGNWIFQLDGTYTYQYAFPKKPYQPQGTYTFDEQTCEIIIGTKLNAGQQANLEVLYMDDQYLMYADDNHTKGYYTILLQKY